MMVLVGINFGTCILSKRVSVEVLRKKIHKFRLISIITKLIFNSFQKYVFIYVRFIAIRKSTDVEEGTTLYFPVPKDGKLTLSDIR
jgi:hypothetical protein